MRLSREAIINHSGFSPVLDGEIAPLRDGYYWIVDETITGDAPKDFIRVYEYGQAKKTNRAEWPAYIAKVGHKWYPNESITEHLLTRIGQLLGLSMAESKLVSAHGQLRFLSRYFLRPDESLVHGAQLFASYLEDDEFVEEVEAAGESAGIFTIEVVRDALRARFPDQADSIFRDFLRMLGFDALVGNNDRHFYNWGVIVHSRGHRPPRFAPIYDTARALFWNISEERLRNRITTITLI